MTALIQNLRRAREGIQTPIPLPCDDRTEMWRAAEEARQIAYNLAPLNAADCDDVARDLNELATACHMLATVVLRLLDESRGKGAG
jgi:hypothetical protein